MAPRFRLANVLRARQAQEDAARAAARQARDEAAAAAELENHREHALDRRPAPPAQVAGAFVAAQAARQSLAAELFAARRLTVQAGAQVADRDAAVTAAAIRRRTLEKLAERHAEMRRAHRAKASQRALDETAARRPGEGQR